jgi:2-oxoglutarate ferredoxin oxidoreductase subunit beta
VDADLGPTMERAARHRGCSFVEIYQDCNVFNHKAFGYATDKQNKEENVVRLEHGKPLVYGAERDKGIRLAGGTKLETVRLGDGVDTDDLLFHDETDEGLAFLLSRMRYPDMPEPMGVFRAVEQEVYEDSLEAQVRTAQQQKGEGKLTDLFAAGDTYEVTAR